MKHGCSSKTCREFENLQSTFEVNVCNKYPFRSKNTKQEQVLTTAAITPRRNDRRISQIQMQAAKNEVKTMPQVNTQTNMAAATSKQTSKIHKVQKKP